MKDIIKYIKLMKYSLQAKMMIILATIFFVVGILFEFTDFGRSAMPLSALYLALMSFYFYQMVFTTTVSKMVQTSPMKKKLQTVGPIVVTAITSSIAFTIYSVVRCLRMTPEFVAEYEITWAEAYSPLVFMVVSFIIFYMYLAINYKQFIISLIFIVVGVFVILAIGGFGTQNIYHMLAEKLMIGDNNPALIIVSGYLSIIVGGVIGYFISLAFYKKDISEAAVRYALSRAQK